jgi:hypothetical protein
MDWIVPSAGYAMAGIVLSAICEITVGWFSGAVAKSLQAALVLGTLALAYQARGLLFMVTVPIVALAISLAVVLLVGTVAAVASRLTTNTRGT